MYQLEIFSASFELIHLRIDNFRQKRAIIMNNVLYSFMCPASGDIWNFDITTHLNLMGITLILN